jgi:hypothetical protein
MNRRALSRSAALFAVPLVVSCSGPVEDTDPGFVGGAGGTGATGGSAGTGGSVTTGGTAGTSTTGGTGGTATGGAGGTITTGGSAGAATSGSGGTAGTSGGSAGAGGGGDAAGMAGMGMGGSPGGMGGAAGQGVAGSFTPGGMGGAPMVPPLDCGGKGSAVENHGPTTNRLNYVIVGDGYSEQELAPGGTLDAHVEAAMTKRFSAIGEPYLRYRKFINICVLRIPSTPICGSSEFGCCGNDTSRLANCNTQSVNSALNEHLPDSFTVDFRAVMLNGDRWWNSGGVTMMWSGGHDEAGGAALHEGGHGFHALSDEYGNCEVGRVSNEASYGVNISLMDDDSGGKWDGWEGYNHSPGTGMTGFFGCDGGQTWRSTSNSMMNSLFGDDPNTSYNPVSKEKIVMDIWRAVESPYDSVSPPAGAVTSPTTLVVNVIDPAVISVDWSVDGNVVAMNGGPSYAVGSAGLSPGMHTVTARVYDNAGMDLVRQVPGTRFNRQYWGAGAMGHSEKTVTWNVTIP